jgi:glycine cleavage system H protein
VGDIVNPGDPFGAIESVKASSELYAPIGGEIVAVNSDLEGNQEPINQDPYGAGWLIRMRPSGDEEELMDAAAYTQYCEERAH